MYPSYQPSAYPSEAYPAISLSVKSLSEPNAEPLSQRISISKQSLRYLVGGKKEENVHYPPLGPARCVPHRKQDARKSPQTAQRGSIDGVLGAGDEQGAEEGRQVLGEVCVGALGCSSIVSILVHSFIRVEEVYVPQLKVKALGSFSACSLVA